MRKLVAFEQLTLDGYAASAEGMGLEWTFRGYSDELAAYVDDHVRADFDTAVYGRRTYELMYGYWSTQPTPESTEHDRAHAEWVNKVDKIVCSTTLESADWNNTRLMTDNLAEEFTRLKEEDGETIAIFGSPKLVHSCIELGLIDEFRVIVHPVTVGAGTRLFPDNFAAELDLVESTPFSTGAVYLRYQVR